MDPGGEWVPLSGVRRVGRADALPDAGAEIGGAFGLLGLLLGAVVGILAATVAALTRGRDDSPQVDFAAQRLRSGRRTVALADIDFARLEPDHVPRWRSVALRFGVSGGIQFVVVLRAADGAALAEAHRGPIGAVLAASDIRIPLQPYDPNGVHARSGSPSHITREEAVALVADPPAAGDALPVAW